MRRILHNNLQLSDTPFLVVDVETTGTDPKRNRVMEIGCVLMQGGSVKEKYSSLVRTGQFIPPFIARMTGITNAMVHSAPSPEHVFRKISEMLNRSNAVFVGHNVEFDWSFVRQSLTRTNNTVNDIPRLCTYKLARRILTRNRKFNLKSLVSYFGISTDGLHRAGNDASATAAILSEFLLLLRDQHDLQTCSDLLRFQNKRLGSKLARRNGLRTALEALPKAPGVYYFFSQFNELMYIGKAKSLRERVHSYFQPGAQHTSKVAELARRVREIRWECTETELSALILESREIKSHKPRYNALIKNYRSYTFLRLACKEDFPRLSLCKEIVDDGAEYFGPFKSQATAESVLDTINRSFLLRECGEVLHEQSPCLYYQISRCSAPCAMMVSRGEYLREVDKVRAFLAGQQSNLVENLTNEMQRYAQECQFEEAAVLRDRIQDIKRILYRQNRVGSSINENNVIIIVKSPRTDNKVELFFIRFGRLAFQRVSGKRLPLKELRELLACIYFDGSRAPAHCRKEEIDEIRIIATWLHQRRSESSLIYIRSQTQQELLQEIANVVNGALLHSKLSGQQPAKKSDHSRGKKNRLSLADIG